MGMNTASWDKEEWTRAGFGAWKLESFDYIMEYPLLYR